MKISSPVSGTQRIMAAVVGLMATCFAAGAMASTAWHVEGEPAVVEQQVSFQDAGAQLHGTLYLPARGNHLPALVVLHAAEAPTRDYGLYRHLERASQVLGFAVLVFDRRGSGASTGTLHNTDYDQLADDGIAGLHAIAHNPRIDPHRIGFWGLSQGGWLAVLAASRTRDAAFAISVSAPMVTPAEQMQFAVDNLLALHGYGADAKKQASDARNVWQAWLRGHGSRAGAVHALEAVEHKPWFNQTFMPTAEQLPTDRMQSSWRKEMDLDPMRTAEGARVPLLFIYGGDDPWVPVARSVQALKKLQQQRDDVEIHVIAKANHSMQFPVHENMAFDKATLLAEHPEAPAYFFVLGSWLRRFATPLH